MAKDTLPRTDLSQAMDDANSGCDVHPLVRMAHCRNCYPDSSILKDMEFVATVERAFWIHKFEHWVKCAEGSGDLTTVQYIKSRGFVDCINAMKSNDRWLPAAAGPLPGESICSHGSNRPMECKECRRG